MPETAADQVTAYLAELRDLVSLGECDCPDVPRLLAVAEAALALVTEWRNDAASLDRRAGKAADAGEESRSLLLSYRAQAHTDCAAQLHGTISAALLEEGENGHD